MPSVRLLAAVRRVCREHAGVLPSIGPVDELLDERGELAARPTGHATANVTKSQIVRMSQHR